MGPYDDNMSVYLNLQSRVYDNDMRATAVGAFYRELAGRLMRWAGVHATVTMEPASAMLGERVYCRADGDARLIGYVHAGRRGAQPTIVIDEKKHVYDCQAGSRLSVPLTITTDGAAPQRHAVHVTVLRPDGSEAKHYSANVALPSGKGALEIPFALNDPSGEWTPQAPDAGTGMTAQAKVRVSQ
jgi:hypothetical protein